jgi:hypothetical protein
MDGDQVKHIKFVDGEPVDDEEDDNEDYIYTSPIGKQPFSYFSYHIHILKILKVIFFHNLPVVVYFCLFIYILLAPFYLSSRYSGRFVVFFEYYECSFNTGTTVD